MNKMKSLFFVIASLALASCGGSSGGSTSTDYVEPEKPFVPEVIDNTIEHEYEDMWSYDNYEHWHNEIGGHTTKDKEPHHMTEWVVDYEGSETEEGRMSSHCTVCSFVDYLYTGKTHEHVHEYASTYSFNKREHWKASLCGHPEFEDHEYHDFTERIVLEADFESDGLIEYVCNKCGYSFCESTNHHTFKYDYNNYSYNQYGHYHKCLDEGYDYLYTGFASHIFEEWIVEVEATEDSDGLISSTCDVCGYKTTSVIPSLNHNHTFESKWSYDETHHFHKSSCGHDVIIDNFKHEFIEETLSIPTYESDGQVRKTCSTCGYSVLETLPALNHHFSSRWSCDETSHYHICLDEGYDHLKSDLEEHDFCDWIVSSKPSCYQTGFRFRYCITCQYVESEVLPLTDHTYSNEWSFTETHHYHKATCGHNAAADVEEHNFISDIILEPDYDYEGEIKYTCTVCDYSKIVKIPKLEHTYSDVISYNDEGHFYCCIDEGYERLHTDTEPHVYGDEIYNVAQSNAENSYQYQICSICGYKHILEVDQSLVNSSLDCLIFTPTILDGESCYYVTGRSRLSLTSSPNTIYIPATYNGLPVRIIGYEAFYNYDFLKCVIFGGNIKRISAKAFALSAIENLYIDDGVVLEENSLARMDSLINLSIPCLNGTLEYYFGMLDSDTSSVKNVEIRSVDELANNAFADYFKNMETLSLPDTITEYPEYCFKNCFNLKNISGPKITSDVIKKGTFYKCNNLDNISFPNVKTVQDYGFYGCHALSNINCPNIEYVGKHAFSGCTSLKEIPSTNITYFGQYSFYNCSSLTSINFNEGVTYIGSCAFEYCIGVTSLSLSANVMRAIGNNGGVFNNLIYLNSLTVYLVPENTRDIFYGCSSLAHLAVYADDYENVLTRLMSDTPTNKLNDITLLNTTDSDFKNIITNYKGKEFTLGFDGNCSTIDFASYFASYSSKDFSVKTINIGASVSKINNLQSLDALTTLTAINVDEDNAYYYSNHGVLFSKITHKLLYVPIGYTDFIYLDEVSMLPDSESILQYVGFVVDENNPYYSYIDGVLYSKDLSKVISLTKGNSEILHLFENTYISDEQFINLCSGTFSGYDGMADIIIDSNNPYYCIENEAIMDKNKTKLYSVHTTKEEYTITDSVKTICACAFAARNTKIVHGGSSLERIENYAFLFSGITEVDFKPGLKWIGDYAFNAPNLKKVYLPNTVEYIGQSAFGGWPTITDFVFGGTIAQFDALYSSNMFGGTNVTVKCSNGEKVYC